MVARLDMDKGKQLAKINGEISQCRRCPLYQAASQAVPGEGNPNSQIVFIGEAPGFYEDREGRPFVGAAGQFLEKALTSINLKREEIFITNIIKHRPPQNRDPAPEEIRACNGWLDKQLAVIQPKVIVTLGRFSLAKFLPGYSISQVHGKIFKMGSFLLFPCFHPAAALRSPTIERKFLIDIDKLAKLLKQDYPNNVNQLNQAAQLDLFG